MEAAIQENKRFSETQICSWAKQIVLALQFLHSHGMAHRDVKTQVGNQLLPNKNTILTFIFI